MINSNNAKSAVPDMFCRFVKSILDIDLVKEYKFHPTRLWRFDYAFPIAKIAIEVEGGIFIHGRHNHPSGFIKDMEKYNQATLDGWKLIRVMPKDLLTYKTVNMIRLLL